jgi:Carboxypeptidase regulatory-like domain/Stage II sporulation protein
MVECTRNLSARSAAATVVALAMVVAFGVAQAAASAPRGSVVAPVTAGIRGEVVVAATGTPVRGATVTAAVRGDPTVRTGADGTFLFPAGVATAAPSARVSVVVAAPGWAPWRITGAPLYRGDTLILDVKLTNKPFVDHVLDPAERASRGIGGGALASPRTQLEAPTSNTCTGWTYQLVPTPTIWVYRTKTGVSEQYDFAFYATHVLPNEWISSWDADSLGAGAIAVRTYSGYRAMPGHAYSSGPNCADVRDTIDGYFDPSWTTASAEQAVYATWGSIVYQNRGLFVAHYFAGGRMDPCAYVTGQYTGWMSQWGTQNCALAGVLWPGIVDTFYSTPTAPTVWHYVRNLLLDPSIGTDALYAFQGINATFTRTHGIGADGAWFLHVEPTPGKTATLYQHRPFLGMPTTPYHYEVWLRCPGASRCAVTLRVLAFPAGAKNGIVRELAVSVPNDGAWHDYTFDPSPHGVDHAFVRASVVSAVPFDVDDLFLDAPYGGV